MLPNSPYTIFTIGLVRREPARIILAVEERFRPALKELERFSHAIVLWWFSEFEADHYRTVLRSQPPYEAPVTGVFGSRSPLRPNPIGLSVVPLVAVNQSSGEVEIAGIDARDGTPVLDIKPYYPCCDRVRECRTPEWAAGWGEWLPDEGLALEEY